MKARVAFLLAALPLLLMAVGFPVAQATARPANLPLRPLGVWRGETAVPGVNLEDQGVPGMALDPDGRPHLVYGRNQLFHAWYDGASWQVETVDPAGSLAGPVIAIDDAGTITIVAFTEASRQRKELVAYTRAPGGAWQTAPIAVPQIATYPVLALALDGDGRPHVVTTGTTADWRSLLIYAHTSPQGWVSEPLEIDRGALLNVSLALDSGNHPVILYQAYSDDAQDDVLRLARRGASGWSDQVLAHGARISGSALALDAGDRVHAVFSDDEPNRLVYLRQTATGWQTLAEPVEGYSPSLALDDAGQPHIAYTNPDEDIVYAVLGGAGWQRTTIPMVGHGGSHTSLLLDVTGAAHISTLQFAQALYYATNRGGPWAARPVAVQDRVGEKHALTLDADDRPYLLYYQPLTGQLRWAAKEGDAWPTSAVADVDASYPYRLEMAAAIGPDDVARIAYTDDAANALIVGTRQGDAWSLETIATTGRSLSLQVGDDNRPQLLIIQDTQLVYWTQQGGVWRSEPISPPGAFVFNAFLALDGDDRPHVVYSADGEVMAAVRQGANNWPARPLPFERVGGMALGPDGSLTLLTFTFRSEGSKPPFTYYTLRLSEEVAGGWQHTPFFEGLDNGDESLDVGRVLVGADGTIHLVTREPFASLRYERRDPDGQWFSDVLADSGDSIALALGRDGQPRVSQHLSGDLRLYTRQVIWLDKHGLLPIVARAPNE